MAAPMVRIQSTDGQSKLRCDDRGGELHVPTIEWSEQPSL
jgi:hypothetical protein